MCVCVCVCVVSAVDDGNCSPWMTCNSSVVQESIRWKGDLWWLSGRRPKTGFVTETFMFVLYPECTLCIRQIIKQTTKHETVKIVSPGSSWGFGALLKGLTSVVNNSCQSRDSNPQPWVTSGFKSNALSIRSLSQHWPSLSQSLSGSQEDSEGYLEAFCRSRLR